MGTNAEAIASVLADAGVEYMFGLPGGEVVALLAACRSVGIQFYLTGHEASAAFMADVTGQITGRPGVCVATLGPGAMNLCLGVANAYLDRSPVLALTGQLSTAVEPDMPHQRLPLTRIFSGMTKASVVVSGAGTDGLARACLALAAEPPYGPVHLALPSNLATTPVAPGRGPELDAAPSPSGAGAALEEIGAMLAEAARPLLVVGIGCGVRDAPAVRAFVDRTGIPFLVTPKAKGILPEDAPGFLGVVGGMAIDRAVMETVDQADFLLGVGFDPVECDKTWYVGRRIANLARAATAETSYRPVECLGSIADHLARLGDGAPRATWPAEVLAAARARMRPTAGAGAPGALSPLAAVRTLREALPRETVLACDVGSHKYFAGQFWQSYDPHTFFMSNGLSGMGYGVPAAIAAKLQFPARPAVALVGDGGMMMMLHNLTFLRQYDVPVVVVCFVDATLSLIRLAEERRGLDPYGVDFPAPEFARIAGGFGIRGVTTKTLGELRDAVQKAVEAREPAVVAVPVDINEYRAYC
ncbi:MAG TPA: thiamine pyrophosphate-binding protein [bacterium]|nr:thiamine pyrophosphate-binding protein [bacterium]